jgi:carboxypeptidase Taq
MGETRHRQSAKSMHTEFAPYRELVKRAQEIALVSSAASLLSWDQETGMPPKAIEFRAIQMGYFSGWTHRLFTAPEVGDWISACEQQAFPPDTREQANVREWRRQFERQTRLPVELVEEFQRVTSLARDAWIEARRRSEFALFQPHFAKVLDLCRQMADRWGYETARYDALLEEYEPGARSVDLEALFAELRPAIVQCLSSAAAQSASIPPDFLAGDYPVASQQAFNREVAEAIGFDFQAGRIDTTTHPFCSSLGPHDCRLTTRYNERFFTQSLYGILHEAGHGLYDQGLPAADYGTPLGAAVSLGIHESQSRLWENHVGRSPHFWTHWHPIACRHFPALRRFTPEQIVAAVNRVSPSFIRVEADQVTYDLHIILRFEIERRLVAGELRVADVPAWWNETFEKMFALRVPDDAHGCLQDIHWSMGSLGYFPTYTLGNLNAAQLFQAARKAQPDLDSELSNGQYSTLRSWLIKNIHQHGQRYQPPELMQRATGEVTRATAHLEHLRRRTATLPVEG